MKIEQTYESFQSHNKWPPEFCIIISRFYIFIKIKKENMVPLEFFKVIDPFL